MDDVPRTLCIFSIPQHCMDCDAGESFSAPCCEKSGMSVFVQICHRFRTVFLQVTDVESGASNDVVITCPGRREAP